MTRLVQELDMQVGNVDISKITFNPKSRDDIPKILRGLQYLYTTKEIREAVFGLLESKIAPGIDKNNGRPGMCLWRIFVMGVIRLDLNCDYDRLEELVNHHDTIRQMLGHNFSDRYEYQMQTIKDNVGLLTPELLEEINQIVVKAGHIVVKKKESAVLAGRCDSFVVETDVHFPTDINLLFDAMRKVVQQVAHLCEAHELSIWRQYQHNIRQMKRAMRIAQQRKRGSAKTPVQAEKKERLMIEAHRTYLEVSQLYLDKAISTVVTLEQSGLLTLQEMVMLSVIKDFIAHAERQINQIKRRVLQGEQIPHEEKIFSIFEPHTEWVAKGKVKTPVELGLRVCVLEDQYQFILHHTVMEKETDDGVAVKMVVGAQKIFPNLKNCSFDKGFHSPANQEALSEVLDVVALPRKGKLSKQAQIAEETEAFIKARRKHSAIESAINGLEVHGLDRCPDHGIEGFKRYVALAVVARNISRIGAILQRTEYKREKRRKSYLFKLAA